MGKVVLSTNSNVANFGDELDVTKLACESYDASTGKCSLTEDKLCDCCYSEAMPIQSWQDITKVLPEEHAEVIIATKSGKVVKCKCSSGLFFGYIGVLRDFEISFWMALEVTKEWKDMLDVTPKDDDEALIALLNGEVVQGSYSEKDAHFVNDVGRIWKIHEVGFWTLLPSHPMKY